MTTTRPSHVPEHEPEPVSSKRWVTYTAAALLLVALGAVMLIVFDDVRSNRDAREAEQKAAELHEQFAAIGITAFSEETIADVLGDDGGGFCADPAALVEATADLGAANGAAGPGLRPSVLDERRLAGDRLVIEVYCPEQLAAFDAYVDSLDLDPGRTTEQGGEGTDATTGTTTEEDA
ncbi:hypothetical protein MT994_18770 [Cellulosimicrobium sp. MI9406]|uniref:hypothetical protein n=1 Tax=Cellulosimicrobium sp. MI9406 TaxID=2931398 RepID=UPI0033BE7162